MFGNLIDIIDKPDWRPSGSPAPIPGLWSASQMALSTYVCPISDYRANNYSNNNLYFTPTGGVTTNVGVVRYDSVSDAFTGHLSSAYNIALGGGSSTGNTGVFAPSQGGYGKVLSGATDTVIPLDGTIMGDTNGLWTRSGSTVTITMPSVFVGTGSSSGNILTISAVSSGSLMVGQVITGSNAFSANTTIVGFLTGSGGTGTYYINNSQTVSSGTVTAYSMHRLTTSQSVLFTSTSDNVALPITSAIVSTMVYNVTVLNNSQFTITTAASGAASGTCSFGQPVRTNQWTNRGDGKGIIIRVIGNSSGGSGKIEERRIVANTGSGDNVCIFTGTISTTTLTVSSIVEGEIKPGMALSGSGVTANTTISTQLTGSTGSTGTYTVSTPQTVSVATAITGIITTNGTLNPIITLDKPLSFTPIAGDSWELLSGRVYAIGSGTAISRQFQSYDVSALLADNLYLAQSAGLSVTNLVVSGSYITNPLVLDEQHVPWDRNPGEGYVIGASTYDTATLTGVDYKNTKGCLLATSSSNNLTAAVTTGSSTSGLVLTVGTISSGTISSGQILIGGTVLPNTIVLHNITGGSTNGSTWAISQSQTVSSSALNMADASITGQATGGDETVLMNKFRNYQVRIVHDASAPMAVGQRRRIIHHSAGPSPKYSVSSLWSVTPSIDAKFVIENWSDCMLLPSCNTTNLLTYKMSNRCQDYSQLYDTWSSSATFTSSGTPAPFGNGCVHFFGYKDVNDTTNSFSSSKCIFYTNTAHVYQSFDISAGINGRWNSSTRIGFNLTSVSTTFEPSMVYNPFTELGGNYIQYTAYATNGGANVFLKINGSSGVVSAITPLRAPRGYVSSSGLSSATYGYANRLGMGVYVSPTDQTQKIPILYFMKASSLFSEMYELLLT